MRFRCERRLSQPSRLRLIRKAPSLARIFETRDLSIEEKAARWKWKKSRSNCADGTPCCLL